LNREIPIIYIFPIEAEGKLWSIKADAAKNEGFLSTEESENFLNDLLHA
jgi:hypothetical protein